MKYSTYLFEYSSTWVTTGGSIKFPTRHQCVQDNGSQQPLGVRTSCFDIINNEMRIKIFSEKFSKIQKT